MWILFFFLFQNIKSKTRNSSTIWKMIFSLFLYLPPSFWIFNSWDALYIVILDLSFSYLYVVVGRYGGKSSSSLQGDAHPFQVFVECKRERERWVVMGWGDVFKVHVRAHPESFLLLLSFPFTATLRVSANFGRYQKEPTTQGWSTSCCWLRWMEREGNRLLLSSLLFPFVRLYSRHRYSVNTKQTTTTTFSRKSKGPPEPRFPSVTNGNADDRQTPSIILANR